MPEILPAETVARPPARPDVAPVPAPRGKKKTFADAYLLNFSVIQAAKAVGAPAGKERAFGMKMMGDPKVATYITRRIAETETTIRPTQLRLMDEMSAIAFNDGDAFDVSEDGSISRLRFDRVDKRTIQQISVRQHKSGNDILTDATIKFHPKADMLKTIGQTNGLIADDGKPPEHLTLVINGGQNQVNVGGRK